MADAWPPPLPTYTGDVGANVVNSLGWIGETLFWPVLGMSAEPRYDNNGALPVNGNSPSDIPSGLVVKNGRYVSLGGPLSPQQAAMIGKPVAEAARGDLTGTISIGLIALPVLAALVVVGYMALHGRK